MSELEITAEQREELRALLRELRLQGIRPATLLVAELVLIDAEKAAEWQGHKWQVTRRWSRRTGGCDETWTDILRQL